MAKKVSLREMTLGNFFFARVFPFIFVAADVTIRNRAVRDCK